MQRKLAAIMAGDIVGYSRLMAEDETATYGDLREVLDNIVEPTVDRRGGHIFKRTGDGFLAAFPSVNEAIDAAVEIQAGFATRALQLRIGLNLGDIIEQDGDNFGDGVNVAARLEAMAEPGRIYVSAAVYRSADKARGAFFEHIGIRHAKNIPDPIDVYAVRRLDGTYPAPPHTWLGRIRPEAPRMRVLAGIGLAGIALAGLAVSDRDRLAQFAGNLNRQVGLGSVISTADARPSVAVLPFDNLSGDAGQTYFSDGLTEDIITELARNRELQVIARNSTFAFQDNPTDIREVGRVLGAGYVVEGSARRSGDQLRVVAQLIDAASGAHVWSRSYDRQVADVFAVQTELTEEIVASLVSYVRASESASAVASDNPTESLPAYDLVLQARARYKHGSSDAAALLSARALFQRAIELDPEYAAAHAHLGMTYIVDRNENLSGATSPRDLEIGLASAREAVRLEPDLPLAYQVLSFGLAVSGDFEGSMHAGERAVELNPSDPDSLMALAKAQVRFGDYEDAVRNAERARRLHPIAPEYYGYVHGQALYAAKRTAEADEVLAACLVRSPSEPNCLRMRVAVQVLEGDLEAARETLSRLRVADPDFSIEREREMRRFGDSPLMTSYLEELTRAQEPASAAVARSRSGA